MKNNSTKPISKTLEEYQAYSGEVLSALYGIFIVLNDINGEDGDRIADAMDTMFDLLSCAYDTRVESGNLSITETDATQLLVSIIVPTLEKSDFDVSFLPLDEMRTFSSLGFLHNYLILITNSIYEESLVDIE